MTPLSDTELCQRLARALARGGDVPPVLETLHGFQNPAAIGFCELYEEPRRNGRRLHVRYLAGSLVGIQALAPEIEDYARAQGCAWITGIGRPGWARVMQPNGYRVIDVVLKKDL